MKTISIINLKGGVGKSVTTINLAYELARHRKRVLVVDMDKQANTTKFYDCLNYDLPSMADVLTLEADFVTVVQREVKEGIDLLPANMNLLRANKSVQLDNIRPQQTRLSMILPAADYDVCLIDCPPDLDMGAINALCASDYAIIPVDCGEWALDGLREIEEQIEEISAWYTPALEVLGVLVTKYRDTKYSKAILTGLQQSGRNVLGKIRYTTKVKEAISSKQAIGEMAAWATAAYDYDKLAEKVMGEIGMEAENE